MGRKLGLENFPLYNGVRSLIVVISTGTFGPTQSRCASQSPGRFYFRRIQPRLCASEWAPIAVIKVATLKTVA